MTRDRTKTSGRVPKPLKIKTCRKRLIRPTSGVLRSPQNLLPASLTGVCYTLFMDTRIEELKKLCSLFEANIRTDFIDRFFELLDWDIANKQGFSEVYREVTVTIEGNKKAPDCSFRIGGARKFFEEAKRASVNIKDAAEPAFQLRRYVYTAKLPLSILTNFAEFAVYDTRIKPDKNDNAGVARIFYCTYKEYEKHFDFLYNTFSKTAILKGSFDRYVQENKNKKDTL
jgi:adenine-specific DNA-methyltransferase